MDKKVVLEFDYMFGDNVSTHVIRYSDGSYNVKDFTEDSVLQAFRGKQSDLITDLDLEKFFRKRCFPETRPDRMDVLESIGLVAYNPYDIIRKTHGQFSHDTFWIRFEGENLTFNDIRTEAMGKNWKSYYAEE